MLCSCFLFSDPIVLRVAEIFLLSYIMLSETEYFMPMLLNLACSIIHIIIK